MPRVRRVYLEDSVYFITLEGPQGEPVFREAGDYLKYLQLVNDCKTKFDFRLYAYALLPDRLHLLIQAQESFPVSQIMLQTTPLYTKYYNQRYHRKGPLFQKRFRSVVVEKETYLNDVISFIHSAPTRYKLAASIEEYPYTSYGNYFGNHTQIASSASGLLAMTPNGESQMSSLRAKCEARSEAISSPTKYLIDLDREVNEVSEHFSFGTSSPDFEFLDKKLLHGFVLGRDTFEAAVKKRLNEPPAQEPVGPVPMPDISKRIWIGSGVLTFALACITFSFYLYFAKPFPPAPVYEPFGIDGVQLKGPMDEIKRILSELSNLDGTIWEVELIQAAPGGEEKRIKDQIRFTGANFESHYFLSRGFSQSSYTVTVDRRGVIMWETTQKNDRGETLTWHGDWHGNKMEGNLNYYPANQHPQSFSFFSNGLGVQSA